MRWIYLSIIIAMLSGCFLAADPFIKEPNKRLSYSIFLLNNSMPINGHNMLFESINNCKEINDNECLAKAYLFYGILLRSDYVTRNKVFFEKRGFPDKTVTYENRYEKSVKYIEKADALNSKKEFVRTCIEKLVREKPLIYDVEWGIEIATTGNCNIE